MSRTDVEEIILKPMQTLFQPPRPVMAVEEKLTALEAYSMALKNFDRATLVTAWAETVAAQRGTRWPVPGIIVSNAFNAARARRAETRSEQKVHNIARLRQLYWQAVRTFDKVQRAAELHVAWSTKLAMVDDNKRLGDINLKALGLARISAEAMVARIQARQPTGHWKGRQLGVMSETAREQALEMFRTRELNEAKTAEEIAAAREGRSQPDDITANDDEALWLKTELARG